jgi:hypothetical protein
MSWINNKRDRGGAAAKVKHFLWRLRQNTLGVRRVLQKRGITKCCMCGRLDEGGAHLVLKCKEVKGVWRDACCRKMVRLAGGRNLHRD